MLVYILVKEKWYMPLEQENLFKLHLSQRAITINNSTVQEDYIREDGMIKI